MSSPFHSFLRFFPAVPRTEPVYGNSPLYGQSLYEPLPDALPRDMDRPRELLPTLPVVAGDTLRFLVPRSFLGREVRYILPQLNVYLVGDRIVGPTVGSVTRNYRLVGKLRAQDGANYTEVRLRVSGVPAPGETRQFALVYDDGGAEVPMLGTFRWNGRVEPVTLPDFVEAIRKHYAAYPYTPVTVDVRGNELTIRAFHSQRFRLGHVPLRVGLGLVSQQNANLPSFSFQNAGVVSLPAQDTYSVSVLDDIEKGNSFTLNGNSYVADGTESPQDILNALGVADGTLTLSAGVSPRPGLTLGSYTSPNGNRPRLEVAYVRTEGGNDLYQVLVGDSVLVGNQYQINIDGQVTRSKTALAGDTVASITAFFATTASGGSQYVAVPQGKLITTTALAGLRSIPNDNRAGLICTRTGTTAARQVTRYRANIASSIRRGNVFVWGNKSVVAPSNQATPADVAGLLGQPGYPFTIDLPAGQTPALTYAEPGPALNADDHLVAADVLAGSIWRPDGPLVCEVKIPTDILPGRCQLQLAKAPNGITDFRNPAADYGLLNPYAFSNYVRVHQNDKDTMLLAYGPGETGGAVMGQQYDEPGLMQLVRVPVALSLGRQRQQESWSASLDGTMSRSRASAERMYTLTTRPQPESFQNALYVALKHEQVYLTGSQQFYRRIAFRQEGEFRQVDIPGPSRLQQGRCDLVERHSLLESTLPSLAGGTSRGADALALGMGAVLVDRIDVPGGIAIYLENERTAMIRQIDAGALIEPGGYRLRVRCGAEALYCQLFVNNIINLQTALTPGILNRTDERLTLVADAKLTIVCTPVATLALAKPDIGFLPLPANTTIKGSQRAANSDFTSEYGPDFA